MTTLFCSRSRIQQRFRNCRYCFSIGGEFHGFQSDHPIQAAKPLYLHTTTGVLGKLQRNFSRIQRLVGRPAMASHGGFTSTSTETSVSIGKFPTHLSRYPCPQLGISEFGTTTTTGTDGRPRGKAEGQGVWDAHGTI